GTRRYEARANESRTHERRGRRMKRRTSWVLASCLAAGLLAAAGCGGSSKSSSGTTTPSGKNCSSKDNITLQSKWVVQAQFAGYYAAKSKGYYDDQCLNVTIKPGGPDITPEQVVQSGQAEFGIDWLPSLLATRDTGGNLVNIAQVFTRSGMTELTWKTSNITTIAGMRDKKVGVWCCGNQWELY